MESSIFIAFVLFLSAFTFSFAGFGFGLVAVPLMALLMPTKDAVAIQLPFSMLLVAINSFRYGRSIKWNDLKPLLIGSAVAIPGGVFSLNLFPDQLMKRTLAIFVVAVIMFERTGKTQGKFTSFAKTYRGGTTLGMISGWFVGAYTTGGPPAVIYATSRFPVPSDARGAMGLYFFATDLLIITMFSMTGLITMDIFLQSIRFTPAVLAGFLSGSFFFNNITNHIYLIGVHFLLFTAAVMLCL